MESCLVEVAYIGIEHALELLLVEDQQMVQTFMSDTSQEALADRISLWCMNRVLRTSIALVVATRAEQDPNVLSLSRIRYFGACP